jgi:hypothetical protein
MYHQAEMWKMVGPIYRISKHIARFSFAGVECIVRCDSDPKAYDHATINVKFKNANFNVNAPDPASSAAREQRQFWQGFSLDHFYPF